MQIAGEGRREAPHVPSPRLKCRAAAPLGLLALALCVAAATPSQAQFYSLEGRYQCLNDANAACYDTTPSAVPRKPQPAPAAMPADIMRTKPDARAAPTRAAAPSAIPADPLAEIAARLRGGSAAPRDIEFLRGRAAARDERATELLAWCHLKGVGMPKDPVPAYLLYGVAAKLGVPNARRNQAIIYETDMTPEQRQTALTIEDRVTLGAAQN
jgi:TPR repeat protein